MSIRLAAPRFLRKRLTASQVLRLQREAANDNRLRNTEADAAIRRALELFGRHGLGAAQVAHQAAERAAMHGDAEGFASWHEVCANLDRRLAHDLARFAPQTVAPA
ncbi:hypothetical protein [Aurantiacibacter xanthus]|uniref:hypothetical protein n=1 Tax=Aurantiacibacter xanthus TaxID=1784712 RepID=UPI001FE83D40|nr:hypothetical protein [Aurantiacibacter xanthus]